MSAPGEGRGDRTLTNAERQRARELWGIGWSLGMIARDLGCSIYALSPWLYADTIQEHDHDDAC